MDTSSPERAEGPAQPDATTDSLDAPHYARLIEAGRALSSSEDVEAVLARVLEAGRVVTEARYAALGVLNEHRDGLARFLTLGIDDETRRAIGDLPEGRGVLGALITAPRPLRLTNVSDHPESFGFPANHPPMGTFLGVPIFIGEQVFGNLYLTEKAGGRAFTDADEEAAVILAQWAAVAIARARAADQAVAREGIAGAERERRRWSRELHDETLQGLGAIRVLLATGLRAGEAGLEPAVADAVGQLGEQIDRLRGLITDLRPAALDEFGLGPALEEVVRRSELRDHNRISLATALAYELGVEETRLAADLESAIYRLAQEALRNAGRHAKADRISVNLVERDEYLTLIVEDDGRGFDTSAKTEGFGLRGLRERVELRGGTISIESAPGAGTTITARLPVERAESPPA